MSLKSLPVRAPASKVLPRKRTVGERIVGALELAALVRTVSRVLGRRKRRRVPAKRGLLALAGGGLLAAAIGVLLAKRKAGSSEPAPPQSASTPAPAPTEAPKPEPAAPSKPAAESEPVKAAVAAAEKLNDIDGTTPGEGATGGHPTNRENAS
jgi:hypothetical protein